MSSEASHQSRKIPHERKSGLIAFSGESGSGKSTLIRRLVALDTARGLRIACIKHTHHAHVAAGEGDSASFLNAGAVESLVAGTWGALRESDASQHDWRTIEDLVTLLPPLDRVYVEGFSSDPTLVRLHLIRGECTRGIPAGTVAIVSDAYADTPLPLFRFSDLPGLSAFLDTIASR